MLVLSFDIYSTITTCEKFRPFVELQVTQGKSSLEQAVKLAKKLKKESTGLRDFIVSTSKDLTKREMPAASRDVDDEISWIKV